jgi:hypothetical protein
VSRLVTTIFPSFSSDAIGSLVWSYCVVVDFFHRLMSSTMRGYLRNVFMLTAVVSCSRLPTTGLTDDPPDLAVYQAVIDSLLTPRILGPTNKLVLLDSTSAFESLTGLADFSKLPEVDSGLIRDFALRNREPRSLHSLKALSGRLPIFFVEARVLSSLPHGDPEKYWDAFVTLYPKSTGHISLSSIGYNKDRTVAMLVINLECGSLCGSGDIVTLKRVGAKWRVTGVQNMWMS